MFTSTPEQSKQTTGLQSDDSAPGQAISSAKLIISVKEARKLLGRKYDNYPDEQIARMIRQLDGIVESYIKSVPKHGI